MELQNRILENINRVFVGKEDVAENLLICFLAGGHVLLEDVPGGKTTLACVLAQSVSCSFGRIQFTPDTLPGDVSGVSVYNMKTGEFTYRAGAVMHQILLADEINRTSPKTQASLLEAMAEGQVTVGGEEVLRLREAVRGITVTKAVLGYMEEMVSLTRQEPRFALGASPRALLALIRAAQGRAFLSGRDFVKPDDVKAVAMQVLLHRLVLTSEARIKKEDAAGILKILILKVKIPV